MKTRIRKILSWLDGREYRPLTFTLQRDALYSARRARTQKLRAKQHLALWMAEGRHVRVEIVEGQP